MNPKLTVWSGIFFRWICCEDSLAILLPSSLLWFFFV